MINDKMSVAKISAEGSVVSSQPESFQTRKSGSESSRLHSLLEVTPERLSCKVGSKQYSIDQDEAEDFVSKIFHQVKLLIWKRSIEYRESKADLARAFVIPILFMALIILLYEVLFGQQDGLDNVFEIFLVPIAFWAFIQKIVILVTTEKSSRLLESMKIMGLNEFSYWVSYFLVDALFIGFITSLLCSITTVGGLFDGASFGSIFGLLFVFLMSAVPFAFFISSFFSSPQLAGQATLGVLISCFAIFVYVILVPSTLRDVSSPDEVIGWICILPPVGLQVGIAALSKGWDYNIEAPAICGILFADTFLYLFLSWYANQIVPSDVGISKPFYFIFNPAYWFPCLKAQSLNEAVDTQETSIDEADSKNYPVEEVDPSLTATIQVDGLKKTFGKTSVVNGLSFNMYEDQIFCLLGHNGAGKSTTINMVTGMFDADSGSKVSIYGKNINTDMDSIRRFMGVCPQHDILFQSLSVKEHIIFFAQLKGKTKESAEREADQLLKTFHLDERIHHKGHELSGGQQRKLSFAIAVCGGSKFIILDEPTAGMDPLARRELWDILSQLRKGRSILLTTHYMDEADTLGDRIGIMSLGKLQCLGSSQFLKKYYGSGYSLQFDKPVGNIDFQEQIVTKFVQEFIPSATLVETENNDLLIYNLPFDDINKFGPFFTALEEKSKDSSSGLPSQFGVNLTSLEDVFLKVGGDHSVEYDKDVVDEFQLGAKSIVYEPTFMSQTLGIMYRRWLYLLNDKNTVSLMLFPVAVIIVAAVLFKEEIMSKSSFLNYFYASALFSVGAYLAVPGLLAEFMVSERKSKLRGVLTVMGCSFESYWIGSFIADFVILLVPMIVLFVSWEAADMEDMINRGHSIAFLAAVVFTAQLIGFSYFFAMVFDEPSQCNVLMPVIVIVLILMPAIIILFVIKMVDVIGEEIGSSVLFTSLLWGISIASPHGAFFSALLGTSLDLENAIEQYPPIGATIAIQFVEFLMYFAYCYYFDKLSIGFLLDRKDPDFDDAVLETLDPDVLKERKDAIEASADDNPLLVKRLRKVFPPKVKGRPPVVATQDVAFRVREGELFGLLGANGAGKSTTLSMLMRHLDPTSGNAHINKFSILDQFSKASTNLGVVTQNNSLWDKLTVESHLYLFARLRGVPEARVSGVVDATINQLELKPHRKKLAEALSGGMKRKLCVAVALIGDPAVVLLDEPSAGLDPVSRRNLWTVILRTMSSRSVVLTTHSMEEAEALCQRIAIMVKGQIRVIGTKQRLKSTFGSIFELEVKPKPGAISDETVKKDIVSFIVRLFDNSPELVSDNGGLLTFRIPKENMSLGKAFTAIQQEQERLMIENFSITQPTLEQVFCKTVNDNTAKKVSQKDVTIPVGLDKFYSDPYYTKTNKCGCILFQMKVGCASTIAAGILFFILLGTVVGADTVLNTIISFLMFISFITCCCLGLFLCCPCCKMPLEED